MNLDNIILQEILNSDGEVQSYGLVGYTGLEEDLEIPAIYNGVSVTKIASGALSDNTTMKSLVIPNSITDIEANSLPLDREDIIYYVEFSQDDWNSNVGGDGKPTGNNVKYYSETEPTNPDDYDKYWCRTEGQGFKISTYDDYMIDSKYFTVSQEGKVVANDITLKGNTNSANTYLINSENFKVTQTGEIESVSIKATSEVNNVTTGLSLNPGEGFFINVKNENNDYTQFSALSTANLGEDASLMTDWTIRQVNGKKSGIGLVKDTEPTGDIHYLVNVSCSKFLINGEDLLERLDNLGFKEATISNMNSTYIESITAFQQGKVVAIKIKTTGKYDASLNGAVAKINNIDLTFLTEEILLGQITSTTNSGSGGASAYKNNNYYLKTDGTINVTNIGYNNSMLTSGFERKIIHIFGKEDKYTFTVIQ